MATALESGESDTALAIAADLWWFWFRRGHFNEGEEWLRRALASSTSRTPVRVRALTGAGFLARGQGAFGQAQEMHNAALQLAKELGDTAGMGWSIASIGHLAEAYEERKKCYEEAMHLFHEAGDDVGAALFLLQYGNLVRDRGDIRSAIALYEDALARCRASGNILGIGHALSYLAMAWTYEGEYRRARVLAEESVSLFGEMEDRYSMVRALNAFGFLARQSGEPELARNLMEQALAGARELGDKIDAATALHGLGLLARRRGDPVAASALLLESVGLYYDVRRLRNVAALLSEFAGVANDLGRFSDAAVLLAAARGLLESAGYGLPPVEEDEFRKETARAKAALGTDGFSQATARGRVMRAEEAVKFAASVEWAPVDGAAAFPAGLTAREVEVLRMVASGARNEDIAKALYVSLNTVKTHVAHVFRKLEVSSRTEAVARARDIGLV
jgi:ATP/maltotriose-dependent transcriptional regulator MalT